MNRYQASPQLEAFLVANAPAHVAVEVGAPSSLAELQAAHAVGGPLPVWAGGSESTIYSSPAVNHAFRAWHDALHIELGAEFDADGEALVNAAGIRRALVDKSVSVDDLRALYFDVWGQFAYSTHHAGQFPTDQAAFVAACFVDFDAALRATY